MGDRVAILKNPIRFIVLESENVEYCKNSTQPTGDGKLQQGNECTLHLPSLLTRKLVEFIA